MEKETREQISEDEAFVNLYLSIYGRKPQKRIILKARKEEFYAPRNTGIISRLFLGQPKIWNISLLMGLVAALSFYYFIGLHTSYLFEQNVIASAIVGIVFSLFMYLYLSSVSILKDRISLGAS